MTAAIPGHAMHHHLAALISSPPEPEPHRDQDALCALAPASQHEPETQGRPHFCRWRASLPLALWSGTQRASFRAAQPIALAPAALTYDAVLEEAGLAAELAGRPKRRESVRQLAAVAMRLCLRALGGWARRALGGWGPARAQPPGAGGACGCAVVALGRPLLLAEWLARVRGPSTWSHVVHLMAAWLRRCGMRQAGPAERCWHSSKPPSHSL